MQKLFVARYTHKADKKRRSNNSTFKIISVTCVICIILVATTLIIASRIPKEAYLQVLGTDSKETASKEEAPPAILPVPDKLKRAKADRLREIRYEDYLAHLYTPLEGEMDNVYIYDKEKKCYLTFDDGPSNITPEILDILKQYKVKATFFVKGLNAAVYPDIIKKIYDDGHSIGNHTYSHDYNSVYGETKKAFQSEVTACQDAIDKALGKKYDNLIFRFPGGYTSLTNETTKALYRESLTELGYKYIDWSCLTGDSNLENPTEEYIIDTLKFSITNTKTGDIVVLLHDSSTKQITADTLPKVIEFIYEQGYEFDVLTNTAK